MRNARFKKSFNVFIVRVEFCPFQPTGGVGHITPPANIAIGRSSVTDVIEVHLVVIGLHGRYATQLIPFCDVLYATSLTTARRLNIENVDALH